MAYKGKVSACLRIHILITFGAVHFHSIRSHIFKMASKILIACALVLALVALSECGGHGGGGHKHVIIHVPIKHTNVHTKKIITKHIKIVGTDDGEVVSHGGEGGDAFSSGHVSGSIHIGEPSYSHGISHHGWH